MRCEVAIGLVADMLVTWLENLWDIIKFRAVSGNKVLKNEEESKVSKEKSPRKRLS